MVGSPVGPGLGSKTPGTVSRRESQSIVAIGKLKVGA
jgi:hypothetical protein